VSARPAERSLELARDAMGATVLPGGPDVTNVRYRGGASDSRAARDGRLFFALPGERVDGFDFCGDAVRAGAAAVVVAARRGRPAGCDRVPVLAVDDPRRALGTLAHALRSRFRGRVVGVTGSNGKTTTKELVSAALSVTGPVAKTAGNLNTDVGLPLTILETTGDEGFWVLEMAMRGLGQIAELAAIARPHVGVVTNVASAHIELLGSLAAIAQAKGEIFSGLADGGVGVLPSDEPLLEPHVAHLPRERQRRFGPGGDVAVLDYVPAGVAGAVVRFAVGDVPVVTRLPLAGEHNARNAAAALAVVAALGLPSGPAAAGLAQVDLPPHRSRPLAMGGRVVLDDCYNANPASMTAALRALAASTRAGGRGVGDAYALLGDMLELGDHAEAEHRQVGAELVRAGFAGVAGVGALGARIAEGARIAGMDADRALTCDDPAVAARAVAGWTRPGDWILVKASRGARLERAIDELRAVFEG
jgi:UDP-N-acetylmuramoyl-tripeptide--D-alanyl-D-alanine ligase